MLYAWARSAGILVCMSLRIHLIIPPMKAISVPDLNGAYTSALEEVRVKRGSQLMSLAPLLIASVTHLKDIGWFSAALDPIIMMRSEFRRSIQ